MVNVIKQIPINIRNQHQLLNLLSEGYRSLSKALMEYIDNSFDSAEDFFNDRQKKYSRDVKILVTINRSANSIFIQDNCEGMNAKIIEGLANSINESEKKRREQKRAWVNGQFGLGAHAYRFFAQQLYVTSKQKGGRNYSILIDRDEPNANLIKAKKVDFEQSGTLVELCGIDKFQIKSLKAEALQHDIEVYFEMLLRRNVEIKIVDKDQEFVCVPFNYDDLTGKEIKTVINSWHEGSTHVVKPKDKGIIVNLKVCTEKIDRPPFFARKGRRINYISHLESFMRKTEHRRKVWENYYLTGYIEVQDNLEPVITRDDFVGGKGKQQKRTGIYQELVKLEDEIYHAIEVINKDKSDESLRNLATQLTDILSDLARQENIQLRYQSEGDLKKKRKKQKIQPDENSTDDFLVPIRRGHGGGGEIPHEEEIKGKTSEQGKLEGKPVDKQKQGIRILFSTLPSEERTHYGDGIITIFTDHPDFKVRKGATHQAELGSMKITARLANYLAAVISSEFKEIFYQQKKLEPSRKKILDEQIDFIFKFEDRMKEFVDQPLHSIGQIKNDERKSR